MIPINYYQLLQELINLYKDKEIVVELSLFNKFVKQVKNHNIYCNFDYSDLEEYANLTPDSVMIEPYRMVFRPTELWINNIAYFCRFYARPNNYSVIAKIWEDLYK